MAIRKLSSNHTIKTSRFQKILLINLPGVQQSGYRPSPLGLLYLAAYVRNKSPKVSVRVFDAAINDLNKLTEILNSFQPDLVGISVMTPSRITAIKISKQIKKLLPKCKFVFGGIHPTLMWSQMMEHYPIIDFIAKGEGEIILNDLISNKPLDKIKGLVWRHENQIINNPDQKLISDLDSIPLPAWDLINPYQYPARGSGIYNGVNIDAEIRYPIIFSRGCMGACSFCSTWKIWRGYRYRSGKNVADEIIYMYEHFQAKHFVFQDDTLTGNRKEIIDFCNIIIKNKINLAFYGCTRVDQVDLAMLKKMKKAGFYEISYGIESGSLEMLKKMNKRADLNKAYLAAMLTKKTGIRFCALMMNGLPTETEKDRRLTERFIKKIKPDVIGTIGEVWILPGTALMEQAKANHLITDRFWLTKRPYYIYRGGIGGDSFNYKKYILDWIHDYLF